MSARDDAPDSRRRARQAALQILYQWEMSGDPLESVLESSPRVRSVQLDAAAEAMAVRLAKGTAEQLPAIDALLTAHAAHWRVERMPVVDRLVLRLAVFELQHEPATPAAVVINEAIELARTFSTEEAAKFVNGLLDAVRRRLEDERAAGPARPPRATETPTS
ncbi:MAG: transcription antitermination factor NusB [Vicinamibacteraceae bacterium]|nr:transcription antitermination factor NusB [Vicinamibacteraceae bacterium]